LLIAHQRQNLPIRVTHGDRVQRTASGDYVYLGRVDNQVKVLGFRVELVMPANVTRARKDIAQAFGTALTYSSPMEGSDGAIEVKGSQNVTVQASAQLTLKGATVNIN